MTAAGPAAADTVTVVKAPSGWSSLGVRDLLAYRELLFFLVWRDVKVKYKQAKIPSEGLPYPVFSFIGLLPWTYFAGALASASTSLVTNAHLVSKIYFPRLLLPASACLAGLIDLLISMCFLAVILLWYGVYPSGRVIWLVPFTLLALCTALGVSLWLSTINIRYRDVQYAVPFLIQIWLFLTPVVYPASMVPASVRFLYGLNPMVAVVEGFRWALADKPFPSIPMMVISIAMSLALLVGGAYYFRRWEWEFADVV